MTSTTSRAPTHPLVLAAVGVIVAAAVAIPLRFGWEELAPDDATYLYVGRTVLDGQLPTDPVGSFYSSRSPLYPVLLTSSDLAGRTDVLGPRLVVWALGVGGLVGSVLLAHRLRGTPAALGTAAALAATPAIWLTVPSLRIDLPLVAGIVATVATLFRPTPRRWLLAGLLAGVVILAKETTVLLMLLPLAWWGAIERRLWVGLAGRYTTSALAVVSWWWVLVWVREGDLAPLAGAQRVAGTAQVRTFELDFAAWGLVALFATGWIAFTIRCRDDPRARAVAITGAALAVPAALAWHHQLALRQFVPLVVMSCVALGAVAGDAVARGFHSLGRRRVLALLVCAATVVAIVVAQLRLEPLYRRPGLASDAAAWLESRLEPDAVVAMNSLGRSELAYRLYDRADVSVPRFASPPTIDDPDDFVWIGISNGLIHALERSELRTVLGDADVGFLVLFSPHRTAPRHLRFALAEAESAGVELVATFEHDEQTAEIFTIDPGRADATVDSLPTRISAEARDRLQG